MMRLDGWRTTMQRWTLVPMVGVLFVACLGNDGQIKPLNAGLADRGAILDEATANYTYGNPRPAVSVDTTLIGAPGGDLPEITIATATQTTAEGRVPGNRFSYKLTSSAAYPAMGIAAGVNYVWRDTSAGPEGPYRLLVVPADPTYEMKWLKRDTSVASYVPEPATEPRLVKSAKGFGACDNNCVPHCVSREFLRSFASGDTLRMRVSAAGRL